MSGRSRVLAESTVAVFLGGTAGSLVRLLLSALQSSSVAWPWMTLLINLTGSFLLGFLLEFLAATGEDVGARRLFRLGVGTGVIGGYTTYGTFILETDTRLMEHWLGIAAGYAVISVLLGLFFAGLGIIAGGAAGTRISRRRRDRSIIRGDSHDPETPRRGGRER